MPSQVRSDPVAVNAYDIAFCDLVHEPKRLYTADHSGDVECLSGWLSMVEFHDRRDVAAATIGAWDVTPLGKQLRLFEPALSPSLSSSSDCCRRRGTGRWAQSGWADSSSEETRVCPDSMTVGADNVALLDLGQETRPTDTPRASQDAEPLAGRVPMVEVHCLRGKRLPAVAAWLAALNLPKKLDVS
jgi:hypothetical protein